MHKLGSSSEDEEYGSACGIRISQYPVFFNDLGKRLPDDLRWRPMEAAQAPGGESANFTPAVSKPFLQEYILWKKDFVRKRD